MYPEECSCGTEECSEEDVCGREEFEERSLCGESVIRQEDNVMSTKAIGRVGREI